MPILVRFVNHLRIMETSAFLTDPARQMRAFRDIHQALGLIEAAWVSLGWCQDSKSLPRTSFPPVRILKVPCYVIRRFWRTSLTKKMCNLLGHVPAVFYWGRPNKSLFVEWFLVVAENELPHPGHTCTHAHIRYQPWRRPWYNFCNFRSFVLTRPSLERPFNVLSRNVPYIWKKFFSSCWRKWHDLYRPVTVFEKHKNTERSNVIFDVTYANFMRVLHSVRHSKGLYTFFLEMYHTYVENFSCCTPPLMT